MNDWPKNSAAITAKWLNDVMRQNGVLSDATVTGVGIADLGTGVGIMGEVARLSIDYDKPGWRDLRA
jgi:hypothetical protein